MSAEQSSGNEAWDAALAETGHYGIASDAVVRASIPEAERCERCDGTGNEFYAMYHRCPKCGGSGRAASLPVTKGDE